MQREVGEPFRESDRWFCIVELPGSSNFFHKLCNRQHLGRETHEIRQYWQGKGKHHRLRFRNGGGSEGSRLRRPSESIAWKTCVSESQPPGGLASPLPAA